MATLINNTLFPKAYLQATLMAQEVEQVFDVMVLALVTGLLVPLAAGSNWPERYA